MNDRKTKRVRISVVLVWLLLSYSALGIMGFSVPNWMQTLSFGEALRHIHVEADLMPQLFLFVLGQLILFYAHLSIRNARLGRFLIAMAACVLLFSCAGVMETGSILEDALRSPLLVWEISRGTSGITWAEGYVASSAFALWILMWIALVLRDFKPEIIGVFQQRDGSRRACPSAFRSSASGDE